MKIEPNSSMFSLFEYDENKQILKVEFSNGGTYDYYDVPKEIFNELISAESVGRYFSKNIKPNYQCKKV